MASPTPTVEDYLGAIYTLARDREPVIGRKLASWMEVSPPTVTATIQRMARDGWVVMHDDKTIHLTNAGLEMAASVVRRHMLTELLLARVLGCPGRECTKRPIAWNTASHPTSLRAWPS